MPDTLRPARVDPVPLATLAALARAELRGPAAGSTAGILICGVTHDSRRVQPGDLFAALPGAHTHGARYVADAVAAGAVAVLTDPAGASLINREVPLLICADPRKTLGPVAAAIYGHPARALVTLGVTGTNGKTTTVFFLDAGLRAAGHRTGLLGTVMTRLGEMTVPSARTTPEAPDIQALLARMRDDGITAAAMEVSSHALALHRVDGTGFACVGFTNLSHDHLDFHGDMENYFAAKARLFRPDFAPTAVIVVDDDYGRRLADTAPIAVRTVSGRPEHLPPDRRPDWRVVAVRPAAAVSPTRPAGQAATVAGPIGEVELSLQLPGRFNLTNALLALAILVEVGIPVEAARAGIGDLAGVPGRLEPVDAGQPFAVLVDYAHTPEAVATVAREVRPDRGRLIIVIGCGGDRDPSKRPAMGAAAAELADLAIFTSDNPRSEDPEEIVAAMLTGVPAVTADRRVEIRVELDRHEAIKDAIQAARPGDVVLIAGKGHEQGQEIGGVVHPFDDRLAARDALRSCGWAA